MSIAVDLDDVLANHISPVIAWHNEEYGTLLTVDDFRTFRLWETWGGTREEAVKKIHHFYTTEYFERTQPVPGAIQGIEILSQSHELVIITGRTESVKELTLRWIDKYFPGKFKDVYFTNHYALNNQPEREKSAICRELGVKLIIEDSLDHALGCLQLSIPVLLFDRPWNRVGIPEGLKQKIVRVFSWQEIITKINALTLNKIV